MYTAILFTVNGDGVATGYSQVRYKSYLIELKNKGFKPNLWGFKTQALAEETANSLVGTLIAETVPPVMQALKGGLISQPPVAQVDGDDTTNSTDDTDDGLSEADDQAVAA